jgi:hypothetical protein
MKILKSFFVLLLITSTAIISCKKSDPIDDDPGTGGGTGTTSPTQSFTAKIDDKSWTSSTTTAVIGDGKIQIKGSNKDLESIILEFHRDIKGQYALNLTSPSTAKFSTYNALNNTSVTYSTKEGTNTSGLAEILEIDTVAKTITGKFNFVAGTTADQTKKTVKEGIFTKLKYTGSIEKPLTPLLSAKVNDTLWTGTTVKPSLASGSIIITATKTNGTSMFLSMPADVADGSYGITSLGQYQAFYKINNNTLGGDEGNLTISEHNTIKRTIKGFFDFKAVDTQDSTKNKSITEGSFQASY